MKLMKTFLALLLVFALIGPSFAVTVEEMHRTDKLMTSTDPSTGEVFLLTKSKEAAIGVAVRGTVGNFVNGAVGDSTSAAIAIPIGVKLIRFVITGAGSVAQTIIIYGGDSSGMVVATSDEVCRITLSGTSGAAGTAGYCPPFVAPYLFYKAVMSGSSGTPTTVGTATY